MDIRVDAGELHHASFKKKLQKEIKAMDVKLEGWVIFDFSVSC